ncbi:MAG: aminotransferase class IV [Methylobacterium sp.]
MLWRDGQILAGTEAPLDHADRGLTLGDGLFDTALALNGRVAFEAEHVARLVASAEVLGIPADAAAIRSAMRALAGRGERLALRTTLTRGAGPRGLKPPEAPRPTLFATAAPSGRAIAFAPLRLRPTAIARNDTSPAARLKTLGYLDAVIAAGEAARDGFDEALFRNTKGLVACAGTGNVFCVADEGTLLTPPLTDGVLAGIVRARVLALAPAHGLAVAERSLTPDDVRRAKAVFVTNSLRLLAPVTALGETAYDSAGHPAFALLREALRAAVAESCGVAPEEVA